MNAVNFVLFMARVWVGAVMFAHGWRHVGALRSGPGMANWLTSLGLRNGPLQARLLTWRLRRRRQPMPSPRGATRRPWIGRGCSSATGN